MNKNNKSSVPDGNDQLTSLWASVKQDRDELRVQIHLAKTEVKDEWLLMEEKDVNTVSTGMKVAPIPAFLVYDEWEQD
mgnify:CR=1 FL=1